MSSMREMQRNHILVVRSKGKEITAVTAIMPEHRARAADNCYGVILNDRLSASDHVT